MIGLKVTGKGVDEGVLRGLNRILERHNNRTRRGVTIRPRAHVSYIHPKSEAFYVNTPLDQTSLNKIERAKQKRERKRKLKEK